MSTTLLQLLQAARPDDSDSELRCLVRQGAVAIDDTKKTDPDEQLQLTAETILRSAAEPGAASNPAKSG
jgi:tyrosyl-tRNA synthetase